MAYTKWSIDIKEGAQARINYDHVSKNLTLSVTNIVYGAIELGYIIDLAKARVPEWVIFGFTAATGLAYEKITVTSWTFDSSSLPFNEENALPPTIMQNTSLPVDGEKALPPTTRQNPTKGTNKKKTYGGVSTWIIWCSCVVGHLCNLLQEEQTQKVRNTGTWI